MSKRDKNNVRSIFLITLLIMTAMSCNKDQEYEAYGEPPFGPPELTKVEQSREKFYQIETLQQQLESKLQKLLTAEHAFDNNISHYSELLRAYKLNYDRAITNADAKGTLLALQKAAAYKNIVRLEREKIESAQTELSNLKEQVKLDVTLLESMDTKSLEEMLTKLDIAITAISPLANELVVNPGGVNLPPLEQVWSEYIRT
ncbi:MAG: hypothetical protein AAB575_03005 [Patescibacteria group bacterium]